MPTLLIGRLFGGILTSDRRYCVDVPRRSDIGASMGFSRVGAANSDGDGEREKRRERQ